MPPRPLIALLTLCALLFTVAPSAAQTPFADADPVKTDRLAGAERIATAVAISERYAGQRPEAVLVRADDFADALAGTVLAVAAEGPLLLTAPDKLSQATADELHRVMAADGTVFLAGGVDALSEQVAADVEALGLTAERVNGATRYETAVRLAELATEQPQRIYLANGNTFADALVAGHTAARDDSATMVLTDGPAVPAATQAYLESHPDVEVVAVGPVAASTADRTIVGSDIFQTSVLAAESLPPRDGNADISLASGTNFPDALAGGTHAALLEQPLLLTLPDELPADVESYLAATPPSTITVYGGRSVVSSDVTRAAASTRPGRQAQVFIDDETPVAADICEEPDGDYRATWPDGTLTLERAPDAEIVAMALRAPGRHARTTDVRPTPTDADDVAGTTGTFDTTQTLGSVREATIAYGVGLGLCNGPQPSTTNTTVRIGDEAPITASTCTRPDGDLFTSWFQSTLVVALNANGYPTGVDLRAAGRDGTSTAIDRIARSTPSRDVVLATFDPDTTQGNRQVVLDHETDLPTCT